MLFPRQTSENKRAVVGQATARVESSLIDQLKREGPWVPREETEAESSRLIEESHMGTSQSYRAGGWPGKHVSELKHFSTSIKQQSSEVPKTP